MEVLKFLHITNKGMVFDPQNGESYQLNESGKIILEGLQDQLKDDEIIQKISQIFRISSEQSLTDVLEFKTQLRILGLLK